MASCISAGGLGDCLQSNSRYQRNPAPRMLILLQHLSRTTTYKKIQRPCGGLVLVGKRRTIKQIVVVDQMSQAQEAHAS